MLWGLIMSRISSSAEERCVSHLPQCIQSLTPLQNLFPVQIENTLTSNHPSIREVAAVAVPDPKYGEVVGVWVDSDSNKLTRDEVRKVVVDGMNPQVILSPLISF